MCTGKRSQIPGYPIGFELFQHRSSKSVAIVKEEEPVSAFPISDWLWRHRAKIALASRLSHGLLNGKCMSQTRLSVKVTVSRRTLRRKVFLALLAL